MTEYKELFIQLTAEEGSEITEEEIENLQQFIVQEWDSNGEFRIDRAEEELEVGLEDLFGEV